MSAGRLYRPGVVLSRLKRAVLTAPKARDWAELALAAVLVAVVAGPAGLATGLLAYEPKPLPTVGTTALIAFFVPALGEELVFRAALIPDRGEASHALLPLLGSTALFTAWHLIEILWQPQRAALFSRLDFLAWAAFLGLVCATLRRRSGSVWTAVLLHWAAVVVWIGCLGGPGFSP